MKARTNFVLTDSCCYWQPKTKRNTNNKKEKILGFINPVFVLVAFIILAGILYLYSINKSAAKGFQVKQVEKDITELKNENEQLKIKEAQLKSLYYLEEASKNLDMTGTKSVSYIEESGPVALK
jgi:hypothetical protein